MIKLTHGPLAPSASPGARRAEPPCSDWPRRPPVPGTVERGSLMARAGPHVHLDAKDGRRGGVVPVLRRAPLRGGAPAAEDRQTRGGRGVDWPADGRLGKPGKCVPGAALGSERGGVGSGVRGGLPSPALDLVRPEQAVAVLTRDFLRSEAGGHTSLRWLWGLGRLSQAVLAALDPGLESKPPELACAW